MQRIASKVVVLTAGLVLSACGGGSSGPSTVDGTSSGGSTNQGTASSGDDGANPAGTAGTGASGADGDAAASGTNGVDAGAASFAVSEGGYVVSGDWHGYAWTSASGAGSTIAPTDFSTLATGKPLCASGSVGAASDSSGVAMIGVNLNQQAAPGAPVGTAMPSLAGLTVSVTNTGGSPLRVQIEGPNGATDASQRWCAPLSGSGGFLAWSSFNTACWGTTGTAYDGASPLASVSVLVPGGTSAAQSYKFCVNSFGASASSGGASGAGGAGGGTDGGTTTGGGTMTGSGSGVLTGTGTLTDPYGSAAVTRDGRNYVVQNNVWGGTSSQTVTYDGTTFDVTQQTGSNPTNGAPVSFPSVFIGSNNGRATTGSNLPKLVSSLTTVPTTWTNNAGGPTGTYDAAYDVWFSTSASGDPASPSGGYLMVWYYKPSGAQPIGSVHASAVTVPGASGTWDVWIGDNGAVPCISYVRTQSVTSMTYDLDSFIQDAVKNRTGTIQSGWYLTNVFAGFEIWSGGQGLQTTNFSAIVN